MVVDKLNSALGMVVGHLGIRNSTGIVCAFVLVLAGFFDRSPTAAVGWFFDRWGIAGRGVVADIGTQLAMHAGDLRFVGWFGVIGSTIGILVAARVDRDRPARSDEAAASRSHAPVTLLVSTMLITQAAGHARTLVLALIVATVLASLLAYALAARPHNSLRSRNQLESLGYQMLQPFAFALTLPLLLIAGLFFWFSATIAPSE